MAEIPIKSSIVSLIAVRRTERLHEVLLLKRAQTQVGTWCQIAGGIEDGETAWQTALRELDEETGLQEEPGFLARAATQISSEVSKNARMAPGIVISVLTPVGSVKRRPLLALELADALSAMFNGLGCHHATTFILELATQIADNALGSFKHEVERLQRLGRARHTHEKADAGRSHRRYVVWFECAWLNRVRNTELHRTIYCIFMPMKNRHITMLYSALS